MPLKDREKYLAYQKAYRERNKERLRAHDRARAGRFDTPEARQKMQNYYQANRQEFIDRSRARQYREKYGLTPESFEVLLEVQGNRCPICDTSFEFGSTKSKFKGKFKRPHVDHDHITGAVRAILCGRCNVGLGSFDDSPERLRAAAEYLVKHRK